jgi:diacylglycerol kinase (ATP)
MLKQLKAHHVSFKYAFEGLKYAFTSQPNFRIHFALSGIAIFSGFILRISNIEMIVIFFMIILGLTTEMINTSIEAVTDLVSKEWNMESKIAKDVSAGMMLLTSIGAIIISAVIFLPKIFSLIHFY